MTNIDNQFPCTFPIKVMGDASEDFEKAVTEIVKQHYPNLAPDNITKRLSRDGHYLSMTFTILAMSKQQMDNIYQALHACKLVKMAL